MDNRVKIITNCVRTYIRHSIWYHITIEPGRLIMTAITYFMQLN